MHHNIHAWMIRWASCPLAFCCLILAGQVVAAPTVPARTWTLNLFLENDLFSETDQNYTSGIRLSWVSPDIADYVETDQLPGWVKRINRRLRFFHRIHQRGDSLTASEAAPETAPATMSNELERNVTLSLGQVLYTPTDPTRTDLIEDDRPYGGWLFLGLGYQTRSNRQLDTLEVRLGVVGPAARGKEAQDLAHDLLGFDEFQGWDNQLRNEPGVVAVWEHKRKRRRTNPNTRFGMDMIAHGGLALGNVRAHLNMGAEFRLGWALPDDFGTSAIRPGGDNSTPNAAWHLTRERKWGLHVFAGFDVRLVGRDIFLDGNTFKKSHSVTRETFVVDAAVGLSAIYGGVKISYAHIFRSREFARQDHSHAYGSLAFSMTL